MVEVAVEFYILRLVSSIELARAVRDPGPCARASCEPVALLLSTSITCTRPHCNAIPSDALRSKDHTSHCTFHTPHFTQLMLQLSFKHFRCAMKRFADGSLCSCDVRGSKHSGRKHCLTCFRLPAAALQT